MGSANTGSAIDVRIDDAGSILKFRIGFSPWFSAETSHLRLSLLVGFGGIEAVDTEFPCRVPIVDTGAVAVSLFADTISDSWKTDPVRLKWGFGEGRLNDKFALFEASKILCLRGERLLAKCQFLQAKRALLERALNWTGSVFPLLTFWICFSSFGGRLLPYVGVAGVEGLCTICHYNRWSSVRFSRVRCADARVHSACDEPHLPEGPRPPKNQSRFKMGFLKIGQTEVKYRSLHVLPILT